MTVRTRALFASAVLSIGLCGCMPPPPVDSSGNPPIAQGHMPTGRARMPEVPPLVPTPINADLQRRAQAEIAAAFASSDPVMRAQAIEASGKTQDPATLDRVMRGLSDPQWLVRFAAAMCAGDRKLRSAYPAVVACASDADPNVRVAVRYAMHQLGDKSLSKELEKLSVDPNATVRANTAMVLGLLKEPTATRVLLPMMQDNDARVCFQTAEALWRLGDETGLKNLIAGTLSGYSDDQVISVLALAAPRDARVIDNISGKLAKDKDGKQMPEAQLAAARALGMLGSDAGYGVAVQHATSSMPIRRGMSAFALGEIGRPDGQNALAKLLADPEPQVRLAAATALRQIGLKAQ